MTLLLIPSLYHLLIYRMHHLEIFRRGLTPFVERQMVDLYGASWQRREHVDTQALLDMIQDNWDSIFAKKLGSRGRHSVYRVRDARNMWAHEERLTIINVYHTLEAIRDLLTRISAHQEVREIDQLWQEIKSEQEQTQTTEDKQFHKDKASRSTSNRPTFIYRSSDDVLLKSNKRQGGRSPVNAQRVANVRQNDPVSLSLQDLSKAEPTLPSHVVSVDSPKQDSQLWTERAKGYLANKQYEEAAFALDRAIQIDPHNSDAYLNKASVMHELGRFQEALDALSWASQITSTSSLYSNRAYMLIKLGRFLEALDASNYAIQLNPNNSHADICRITFPL